MDLIEIRAVKPTISIKEFTKNPEQFKDQPPKISKYAVVDPEAEIGPGVEIGPFCVIGPKAKIGAGTILQNNVTVMGDVTLGVGNRVFPGSVLGGDPQDVSYRGTETKVVIGDYNVFRECVTINRASEKEDGYTRVGSNCYFMGCVHIAHDCQVGDHVVIANGSMLGGHVHCDSRVTLSGGVAVTHFASIGRYAFVGGISRILQDIPPYMLADGNPARPRCVNVVALKRNDFPSKTIKDLTEAYRLLFRSRVGLESAREILINKLGDQPEVKHLLDCIEFQQNGRHGRGREARRNAA